MYPNLQIFHVQSNNIRKSECNCWSHPFLFTTVLCVGKHAFSHLQKWSNKSNVTFFPPFSSIVKWLPSGFCCLLKVWPLLHLRPAAGPELVLHRGAQTPNLPFLHLPRQMSQVSVADSKGKPAAICLEKGHVLHSPILRVIHLAMLLWNRHVGLIRRQLMLHNIYGNN